MLPQPHHTLVISHRANEGNAPENSLIGIARAIEDGCAVVEVGVRATRDGVLVLLHDETLNGRPATRARILDVTYAELSAIRTGALQGHEPQPIPTLAEAYAPSSERTGRLGSSSKWTSPRTASRARSPH